MDTYLYLLLTLILLALAGMIFALRPDLRRKMLRAGIIGGFAGILAELWYFTDYWRPPTLLGIAALSPEDALVGVALAALGVSIYDTVFRTTDLRDGCRHPRIFLALFLGGFTCLLVGSTILRFNSVIISEITFAACALVMVLIRRDLIRVALLSGLLMGIVGFVVYLILFTWLAPHYWHTYWLLTGTKWGGMIFDIPYTEIAWFFAWGMLAGVIPNFRAGLLKVPRG